MIPRVFSWFGVAAWGFALGVLSLPSWADEPTAAPPSQPTAEGLVQAALEAEASGDAVRRGELLREAVSVDPQHAPARWHSGYVRVDDQWLSVEEAEERASSDARLAEYRRMREAQAGTPLGELALARFCRDHGLPAEAKVHWLHVLQVQPNHQEALRSLGVRWYNGQLLTPAQIEQAREMQVRAEEQRRERRQVFKRWERHWTPLVERWLAAIQEDDSDAGRSIEEELRALEDLEETERQVAIAGLDRAIQRRCSWEDKKELEAYRQLSLKLVKILDAIPDFWSTSCLVQSAVCHPMKEVRTAAADALGKRPMETYVPHLIAGLATPIEAAFAIVTYPDGSVGYQQSLSREGLDVDYYRTYSHSVYIRGTPRVPAAPAESAIPDWVSELGEDDTIPVFFRGRWLGDVNLKSYIDLSINGALNPNLMAQGLWLQECSRLAAIASQTARQAAANAEGKQRWVEQANAAINRLNEHIQDALRRATGVDAGTKATDWWVWWRDWWYDHYELESLYEDLPSRGSGEKPVYHEHYRTTSYVQLPSPPEPVASSLPESRPGAILLGSCFPRGTKVWTVTGPVPVEEIKVGDRVLSQDPESGELAYKPVLETTTRNPSPTVKIHVGSDTLETTRGHMFFVSGKGWRMAKELATGDRLRGVGGAVSIDRLEQAPAAGPWYEYVEEAPDAASGYGSAYNLIVDDFHTFFVGADRVLVHDNTLFGSPYGQVPGLPAF